MHPIFAFATLDLVLLSIITTYQTIASSRIGLGAIFFLDTANFLGTLFFDAKVWAESKATFLL